MGEGDGLPALDLRRPERLTLGPLEPLLADDGVTDILVNGPRAVWVERRGRLSLTEARFRDDEHLLELIQKMAAAVGRRIDALTPMVDARLADGSRITAVVPPLALDGPCLAIRRFARDPFRLRDLLALDTLRPAMADYLEGVVRGRLNVIISGGAGAGKTTLLNCLTAFIPPEERVVTIEDSAELQLQLPHVVRFETRPPDPRGRGEVTQRDLFRTSLRMRPDRIIIGEVRGGEALDALQAMTTGHDGSLATLHATTPRDCLHRLGTMVLMAGLDISPRTLARQLASAVHVIVQCARLPDGSRRVVRVTEVTGLDGEHIQLQYLFEYEQTGTSTTGTVEGRFRATGLRSHFFERLVAAGIEPYRFLFDRMDLPAGDRSEPGS